MTSRTKIPKGKWSGKIPDFARRIGEASRANRVVLFGSAARGDMREHSDLDFLVLIPDTRSVRMARKRARRSMLQLALELKRPPMDILVAREWEARRLRDCPHGPIKFALDEGVEVWRAAQG